MHRDVTHLYVIFLISVRRDAFVWHARKGALIKRVHWKGIATPLKKRGKKKVKCPRGGSCTTRVCVTCTRAPSIHALLLEENACIHFEDVCIHFNSCASENVYIHFDSCASIRKCTVMWLIYMQHASFLWDMTHLYCHVREGAFKSRAAIRKVSWHDSKKKMSESSEAVTRRMYMLRAQGRL